MAILKIARMGHPILKGVAQKVAEPKSSEIHNLIRDMLETMEDAGGVGLAAPQVHVPLRLVIFEIPLTAQEAEDETPRQTSTQILINPIITPLSKETDLGWEGCLSVPELRGAVPRFRHIRYQGVDETGDKVDREVQDFHARVVQHECDHLDGILYPMRMTKLDSLHFISEMRFNTENME